LQVSADTGSFPFVLEDERVYVPVQLGTDSTEWFILDTGADGVTLDPAIADELHLVPTDTQQVSGAGQHTVWRARVPGRSLSIGGVAYRPEEFAVLPIDSLLRPSTGRRIPGIIGAGFFRSHVIELDFERRIAHVAPPGDDRAGARSYSVPLQFRGAFPTVDGVLTLPGGHRVPIHLLVDLGAKATLLISEAFASANGLPGSAPTHVRSPLGAGIGGETWYDWVRLASLSLGADSGVELRDFVSGISANGTLHSTWYDALLGTGFLERFRVRFDFGRRTLGLEPIQVWRRSEEYDMSGLFLLRPGGPGSPVVVRYVVPSSPAGSAGVRAGDVLETVDSRPVAGLSLAEIRSRLRSGEGVSTAIQLHRDTAVLTRTIVLRQLI
jgi:hypothetical protein